MRIMCSIFFMLEGEWFFFVIGSCFDEIEVEFDVLIILCVELVGFV